MTALELIIIGGTLYLGFMLATLAIHHRLTRTRESGHYYSRHSRENRWRDA